MPSYVLDFLIDAGVAYAAYLVVYAASSWQILSNHSHGRISAWEELFNKLTIIIECDGVLYCREKKFLSLPYPAVERHGTKLKSIVSSSRQIRRAIARLRVLRDRLRMFVFGLLFAAILAYVVSSLLLFGFPRWPHTVTYAMYFAASTVVFGVCFNLPHAVLWSQLQDEFIEIQKANADNEFRLFS